MKSILAGLIISMLCMNVAVAEFIDPMKPPEFALKKYRLQKLKENPVKKNVSALKAPEKKGWVLSSILYSSKRQHAIVNNTLVKRGDKIDGARIMQVTSDAVRLAHKGKIINLRVNDLKARGLTSDPGFKMIKKSLKEKKI